MVAKKKTTRKRPKKKAPSKTTKSARKDADVAPAFVDVNDKNLRNNFGNPPTKEQKIQVELRRLNERLNRREPYRKEDTISSGKIIAHTLIVITLAIFFLAVFLYFPPGSSYVEDGACFVSVKTFDAGDKERQKVSLPGVSCHTKNDCKEALLSQKFSESDIRRMRVTCEEM